MYVTRVGGVASLLVAGLLFCPRPLPLRPDPECAWSRGLSLRNSSLPYTILTQLYALPSLRLPIGYPPTHPTPPHPTPTAASTPHPTNPDVVHNAEFRTFGRKLVDNKNNEVAAAVSETTVKLNHASLTDVILSNLKRIKVRTTAGDLVIWDVVAAENRVSDGVIVLHGPANRLLTIDNGTASSAAAAAAAWSEVGHTLDGRSSQAQIDSAPASSHSGSTAARQRRLMVTHRGRMLGVQDGGVAIALVTVQTELGKDSEETCSWWSCWWSPTVPSYSAKVWVAEDYDYGGHPGVDDYLWPEQQLDSWGAGTANVGVSISGGGTRSYAAGFGQIRGLYDTSSTLSAKLLSRVRYMAGISGGAWVGANYMYGQTTTDDDVFVGAVPDPSTLDLASLGAAIGSDSLAYVGKTIDDNRLK